ncbi:MAG: endonuclease/exonuclease/phosphatase family protein [Candidatus Riflebacteria bacterium]|nr:endonuclease/exonuclease/phosphatase family protein [Candidatus Riflebacteria bacterium]
MGLRILTYNILTGGIGPAQQYRVESILEVITGADPDLVAIQEAYCFAPHERDLLRLFADRLDMTGLLAPGANSHLHVALLARRSLNVELIRTVGAPFRHACLVARIRPRENLGLKIVVTHLDPFQESARLREVERLLEEIDAGEPCLVMGDLNGLSPLDPFEPASVPGLLEQYRRMAPDGSWVVESRALPRLLLGGLIDLGHGPRRADDPAGAPGSGPSASAFDTSPTWPTRGGFPSEGPPIRIDYVLATPAVGDAVTDYRAIRTALTDRASDHYPVLVELDAGRLGHRTDTPT